LATTGLYRRAPWEPHCILPSLPHEVLCGDSWGDSLLLANETGVSLLVDQLHDGPQQQQNEQPADQHTILDNSLTVRQMAVLEAHGILLIRADKG